MALTPLSDALSTLLAQVDLTPETKWVALEAAGGRYAAEMYKDMFGERGLQGYMEDRYGD